MLRRLGVGMLALAAVALVAMSPIGLQGQGGPILLGGVGPLSEPGAAESGAEMKMAMELAVDELNAQGGVLGREVRLQFEDTRGLPEEGAAAMNRLADAGAVGVAGEFHSAVAKAEIEVANARKLPFVIAEAWSDSLTAAQYPYVFRIAPAVSLFYTKVADWIRAAGDRLRHRRRPRAQDRVDLQAQPLRREHPVYLGGRRADGARLHPAAAAVQGPEPRPGRQHRDGDGRLPDRQAGRGGGPGHHA